MSGPTDAPTTAPEPLRLGAVELDVPEDWSREDRDGADALLLAPPDGRGFRASTVVRSRPAVEPETERLEGLLGFAGRLGPILAFEPFPQGGPAGRRVDSLYRSGGHLVRVTVWTATAGGRHIEVTVSRPLLMPSALGEAVARIARGVRVHDADRTALERPVALPPSPEPWPSTPFAAISGEAWRLLWASAGHGFQPGPARTSAGAELREAGLMTRFGGTTPEAERLLRAAKHGRRGTVRRWGGPGDAIWSVWGSAGDATVDLGRIEGDPAGVVSHRLEHSGSPLAIARLLEWMGIRATTEWRGEEPADVDAAAVEARLRARTPAPAAAGPGLAAAWGTGEWAAFEVESDGAPAVLRVLRAGDGGWWHQGPESDARTTLLTPMPASTLVDLLTDTGTPA